MSDSNDKDKIMGEVLEKHQEKKKENKQKPLEDAKELEEGLEEEEEELFRESPEGEIPELDDEVENINAEVSEDEIKKEHIRKISEHYKTFRVVIPKEFVEKYNLRPKDKVAFIEGDDIRDNVIHLKMIFEKDPRNFRVPFDKWEEMYYDE